MRATSATSEKGEGESAAGESVELAAVAQVDKIYAESNGLNL